MFFILALFSLCVALAEDTLTPPLPSPTLPYALRRTALVYGATVRVAAGVPREEAEIPVSTASSLAYLMGHLASLRERFVAEELWAPSIVSSPCPAPPSPANTTQWMLCVLDRGSLALVSAGVSNAAALMWKELPPSHKLTSVYALRLALMFASVHPFDTKDSRARLLGKGGLMPIAEGEGGAAPPPLTPPSPPTSPEEGGAPAGEGSSAFVGGLMSGTSGASSAGGGVGASPPQLPPPPPPLPPPPYLPGSPPHPLAPLPENSYPEYPEIPFGVDFALAVAGLVSGIPLEALGLDLGTQDTITPVVAALGGDEAALVRARLAASVALESERWAALSGWKHPPPPFVLNSTALELAREERVHSREKLMKLGVAIAPSLPTAQTLAKLPDAVFARQEAVRRAFQHDWRAYTTLAWGKDVYRPLSRTHTTDLCQLGETLVDSLDTLLIMGLAEEYIEAREWVLKSLPGEVGGQGDINLFECSIRIVGGLLGAYDLSGDPVFLIRGESVARAMVEAGAFASPTGIPYSTLFLESREWREMDGVMTMGGCLTRLPFQCATTQSGTPSPSPPPSPSPLPSGGNTPAAEVEAEGGESEAAPVTAAEAEEKAEEKAEEEEEEEEGVENTLECNTPGLELPRAVPGNAAVGIRTVCGHAYNPTQTAGCSSSSEVATLQVEMSTLTGAFMELGLDVITAAGLVNAALKDMGGGGEGEKGIGEVGGSGGEAALAGHNPTSPDTPPPPSVPSAPQEEPSPQSPLSSSPSPSSPPSPPSSTPPPIMPPQSPVFMRAMALLTQLGGLQLPNPPVGTFSYHSLGRTAQSALLKADPPGGLYPIFVHPQSGAFLKDAPVTLGARGDSLYEYLLKEWLVLGGWRSERRRASALATLAVLALSPSFSGDEGTMCSGKDAGESVEGNGSNGGGGVEESSTLASPPPTPLPLIFTEKEVEVMVDTEVQGVITTAVEVSVEVEVEVPSEELRDVDVDVGVDVEVMVEVEVGVEVGVSEIAVTVGGMREGPDDDSGLSSTTPTTTTTFSTTSSFSPTVSRTTSLSPTVTALSTSTMSRTVTSSSSYTTTMTSSLTSATTIVAEALGGGGSPSFTVLPSPPPTPSPTPPTPPPIIPPLLLSSSLKAITLSREDDPRDLLRSYNKAVAGIMDRLLQVSTPSHYVYVAEQQKGAADVGEDKEPLLVHKMDHLVCFLPGMLALGSVHGAGHEVLAAAREKSIRGNAVVHALKTHFPQLFPATTDAVGGGGGGGDIPPHTTPSSSAWPWDSEYEEDVEYRNPPPPSSPHHFNNVVEEEGGREAGMDYLYTYTPHPLRCNGTCTSPPSPTLITAYSRGLELVERWSAGGEVLLLQDLDAIGRWGRRDKKGGGGGGCEPLPTWPPFPPMKNHVGRGTGAVDPPPPANESGGADTGSSSGTPPATPASDSSPDAPTPSLATNPTTEAGGKREGKGEEETAPSTLAGRILAAANRLARAAVPVLAGGAAKSAPKTNIAPSPDPIIDPFAYLSHPGHIRATLLSTATELTRTCVALYTSTTTGLAPEIVTFQSGGDFTPNADARHSFLRPETVESLFVLRALGLTALSDEGGVEGENREGSGGGGAVQEEIGAYWDIFNAMERHARVRYGGHATVKDVGLGPFSMGEEGGEGGSGGGGVSSAGVENMRDRMDSFVLAETYKYLYLLASPLPDGGEEGGVEGALQGLSSINGWVFNTEAHPVRVRDTGPSTWRLAFEGVTKKQQQQQK